MKNKLIVALDVHTKQKAIELVKALEGDVRYFKIGLELFGSCGPSIVDDINKERCKIFLDLKLHDIPTTVAKTASALTKLGVAMFNVHALGGYDMMEKTAKAVEARAGELKVERPKVLAVTILTSMTEENLQKIGIGGNLKDEVLRLACLARDAGLDGVVASPEETSMIREKLGKDFIIVTPGVRPIWADKDDQKRIATPKEAVDNGADYIVVGRPVTAALDPREAVKKILKEIE